MTPVRANGPNRRRLLAAAVAVVLAASGCAGRGPGTPQSLDTIRLVLRSPDGQDSVRLTVQDAYLPATRRVGLMHSTELPSRGGMVFRYPDNRGGSFWMKDTLIPLSIAFFDATGEVRAVLDMEPCRVADCPYYDPEVEYRGALEVNQGFFGEIGLEPGWRVVLPANLPPAQS